MHKVEYFLEIAESLGCDTHEKSYEFFITDKERNYIEEELSKAGIKKEDFLVVINPGGNWLPKRWPEENFARLCDLLITKSGGLTVSEALSKKLPMIIIKPIPGQETRNCRILEGYGVAVRANTVKKVETLLQEFMEFPEKMIGMKARINLLSYKSAAKDIAGFAVKHED